MKRSVRVPWGATADSEANIDVNTDAMSESDFEVASMINGGHNPGEGMLFLPGDTVFWLPYALSARPPACQLMRGPTPSTLRCLTLFRIGPRTTFTNLHTKYRRPLLLFLSTFLQRYRPALPATYLPNALICKFIPCHFQLAFVVRVWADYIIL